MEEIVVGIDDSDASRAAIEWVAQRCARRAARVRVVSVVWDATADPGPSVALLAGAEKTVQAASPAQKISFHRAEGSVARTLAEFSARADLLVIGVDPAHPVKAALGGWLPIRVIARAASPVCVVPAGWHPQDGIVVVGVADDVSSAEALRFAGDEADAASRRVRVVHAWRLPDPAVDGSLALLVRPETALAEHRALLEAAATTLRRAHPRLSVESDLARSTAADALLGHAGNASMIVIGSHREGVLAGGYVGSVAQDILWHVECPVVVVPSPSFPGRSAPREPEQHS